MSERPRHYLSADDLLPEEVDQILDLADELRDDRAARLANGSSLVRDELGGQTVAMIFEKPSTRTRVSFQVAVSELGGQPLPLSASDLQLGRGETIGDTAAVLSRYVHGLVVRTFGQERVVELADAATIPVVNALTDREHPCQALADLQTFRQHVGGFEGRTLTYVGDGNNVAHSLLLAGAKVGLSVRVVHPEGYGPDPSIVGRSRQIAAARGARIVVTTDVTEGVTGSDALYTDVWASMGQEDEAAARAATFAPYQVNRDLMDLADGAIFLHCLPAHRGEEVAADVIDGPASVVFDQAENRLHAQKALLVHVMGRRAA